MKTSVTKRRVLLIDDDDAMREIVEMILLEQGLEVVTVADGVAALETAKASHFDLVLSDLRMPKMSGLDVLVALKALEPQTPVIILTAYASKETAQACMDSGAFDYMRKPFMLGDLVSLVNRALPH